VPTAASSRLRTDLVVTAPGYHWDPLLAYCDPTLCDLRTNRGRVLDTTSRALRRVYSSGWAATGARGVLIATMIDAYAVTDAIMGNHLGDGPGCGGEVVPVQGEAYSNDVLASEDVLESVPRTVEQGVKEKRVVEYDEWKKIDGDEMRRCIEGAKEHEIIGWEEVHEFLMSA
jgi:adrenodoxin-NADP+ reductase